MSIHRDLLDKHPKPIASDGYGVQIHGIDHGINDQIFGVSNGRTFLRRIYYGKRDYFNLHGRRYYIGDFMTL